MANQDFHPSRCTIERAELVPLVGDQKDITALISSFEITQSLNRTAMHVTVNVYDGVALLENMPVRGEETIELEIKCYDLETTITIKGKVYKVDNVIPSETHDAVYYTLHVLTQSSYNSSLKRITKAYRDQKASTIAKDVFKRGYGGAKFTVQDSDGTLRLTIPKYTPSEALRWLTMKSFSKESHSCSYRFFENFDGYYFVTDEYLAKQSRNNVIELDYNAFVTLDPQEAEVQIKQIESMENDRRVNVGQELQSGAYYSSVMEIDVNNHTAKRFNYDYLKELNKYIATTGDAVTISQDIHTEEFIKSTFNEENSKQFVLYRDYDDKEGGRGPIVRGEQYYKGIIQNRNAYDQHLNATRVIAKLKGRLDIKAGDFVKVNARKFNIQDNRAEKNEQLSGEYLVFTSTHSVSEGLLDTTLTLIKYDWHERRG